MKTTTAFALFFLAIQSASAGTIDTFGSGANSFDIEFANVTGV